MLDVLYMLVLLDSMSDVLDVLQLQYMLLSLFLLHYTVLCSIYAHIYLHTVYVQRRWCCSEVMYSAVQYHTAGHKIL